MAFLRERGIFFTDGQPANVEPLEDLLEAYLRFWLSHLESGMPIDPLGINRGRRSMDPVTIFDPVLQGVNVASRITLTTKTALFDACLEVYNYTDAVLATFASGGRTLAELATNARAIVDSL